MTLRRFPWKAPRISDNSYRLFVSPPDPDQDKLLNAHRGSASGQSRSEPASRNSSVAEPNDAASQHHHNQGNNSSEPVSKQSSTADQATIKGPLRLLRLLPRETRHIIGRMLELDPKKRATMEEILKDPWVENSLVCRQDENGEIIKAPNHTHTLQPSSASSAK